MTDYDKIYEERERNRLLSKYSHLADDNTNYTQPVATPAAKPKEEPGLMSSVSTGVMKGVNQGFRNLFNAIDDAGNWLNDNVANLRTASQQAEYERLKAAKTKVGTEMFQAGVDHWNDGTTANQVSADVSEFLLGFIPAFRAEKAFTGGVAASSGMKAATSFVGKTAATAAEGAAAGALASATTVTPETANLSKLINDHFPSLSNPVTKYLQVSPDDADGEKRFKQAMDSVLSGVIAAPLVTGFGKAIGAWKNSKIAEGVDPAAEYVAAREATEQAAPVVSEKQLAQEASDFKFQQATSAKNQLEINKVFDPRSTDTTASHADLLTSVEQKLDTAIKSAEDAKAAGHTHATLEGLPPDVTAIVGDSVKTLDELKAIQLDLSKLKGQSGFFDPKVFSDVLLGSTRGEVLSSLLGGGAGAASADWSDPKNVLGMAALGAVGGRMMFRMKSPEEIKQFRRENPVTSVLATREGLENIKPKAFSMNPKGMPLKKENIQAFAAKVRSGAYEKITPEDVAGMNGLIRNIDSEEDIKKLLTETYNTLYDKGVRSWDEVRAGSAELQNIGTVTDLFKRTKNLDSAVDAARTVITASATELKSLAKRVADMENGLGNFVTVEERAAAMDATVLAFEKATKLHAALTAQVFGSSSEIGRALNAHRMMVKEEQKLGAELSAMVEASGGRSKIAKIAKSLEGVNDPAAITKAVETSFLTRLGNAALYTRLTGLLWSPVTQTKNIVGSVLKGLMLTSENYIQATIAAMGKNGGDRMTFEEANEFAYGFYAGVSDLITYVRKEGFSMPSGTDLVSKERMGAGAYQAAAGNKQFVPTYLHTKQNDVAFGHNLGDNPWGALIHNPTSEIGQMTQKGLDWLGAVQGANLSFMGATDSLFQALNYRASMHGQAYRLARAEGHSGDALAERIAQLIDSPTKEMAEKSMADALDATFQKNLDPSSGAWLDKMGHGLNQLRHQMPILSVLTPFVKTPTNIMRDVVDRIPVVNAVIGGVAAENRKILMAGGPEADKLVARWVLGGTLLTAASYLTLNGTLIGGQEFDKNGLKQLAGEQQYSLKIGDKTYSINGIDPIGMFFGLAADVTTAIKHGDSASAGELAAVGLTALTKNLLSKSYATGLFEFFDMINDVARKNPAQGQQAFEKWVAKQTTSFTPFGGLAKNVKQQVDPVSRDYNNWKERFKANLPGLSDDLLPKRNVLTGEPIRTEGAWGPDTISPFYEKSLDNSPIVKELLRLNMAVDPMDKYLDKKDKITKLTPEQYDRLQVIATKEVTIGGKTMKEALDDLVSSPMWERYPESQTGKNLSGTKESRIRTLMNRFRDQAEKRLIMEDELVKEKAHQNKLNKFLEKAGKPIVKPTE